jgi:glycosyltransferase involved in cell wall biosynthesis
MNDHPLQLAVVSHSCVLAANQRLWAELSHAGIAQVSLIVPERWNSSLHGWVDAQALPELLPGLIPLPVRRPGDLHRHTYRGLREALADCQARVVYLDEDPHSLVAWQVAHDCRHLHCGLIATAKQNIIKRYPPPFSWIERRVLGQSAALAATSEECLEVARHKGYRGPARCVYYPIDTEEFRPPAQLSLSDTLKVGYAGRFIPEKGLDDLIEAVALAQRRIQVELSFVGDGPQQEELEQHAADRLLTGTFYFLPDLPPEQMPELYHSLDVLVLPSRTTPGWKEQFGRVAAEAMACGLPVIGSTSGFIPELIAATGGGVVVPEGNIEALAEAILGMAGDDVRRRQLGLAGRAGVEAHYSIPAIARDVQWLIEQAAGA